MPPSNESGSEGTRESTRRRRPVLDGAAFGVYEDDDGGSRLGRIVAGLLAVAVLVVGFLVWRAVNTDAQLGEPDQAVTSTTVTPGGAPSVEDLRALIPAGLDTCAPLGEPPDAPPRVSLLCPRSGTPEAIGYVLFASIADREAEFDRLVDSFGVPAPGTDCALGGPGVHDYVGFDRVGRVACSTDGGIVDFAWTSDEAPVMVRARGPGPFSDHYAFWDRVVERTDGRFPLPPERELLDELPEEQAQDCRRDLELDVASGGAVAVVCEVEDAVPETVSSVQFADETDMAAWIGSQRSALTETDVTESDEACTPDGFVPDGGIGRYDLDGRTGRVLCFTADGTNTVVWARDDPLVGSVAVSDGQRDGSMRDLLEWWRSGGHQP